MKFVPWKDRKAVAYDLKAIYSAPSEEAALLKLEEFQKKWALKKERNTHSINAHNVEAFGFKYMIVDLVVITAHIKILLKVFIETNST